MGGLSRNRGGCHIILRFSFVNKNVVQKIIASVNYEMIGIAIVLIVLIVIIAVLIIHANNKHSVRCFYLSYNVNKHVLL